MAARFRFVDIQDRTTSWAHRVRLEAFGHKELIELRMYEKGDDPIKLVFNREEAKILRDGLNRFLLLEFLEDDCTEGT